MLACSFVLKIELQDCISKCINIETQHCRNSVALKSSIYTIVELLKQNNWLLKIKRTLYININVFRAAQLKGKKREIIIHDKQCSYSHLL